MNTSSTRQHQIYPEVFPEAWASGWGEDEYGLWMSLTYKGVTQGFRWIEPSTFLMGSPESDKQRYSREVQFEVTFSSGFWIADTTVTQALWEAVMGENPSKFKGMNRPVENVGWHDVIIFTEKMNSMKPELALCLPTEAQWEYACRAGTTTPFYFGEKITFEDVNYTGDFSSAQDEKSKSSRGQAIEVKSLPCNAWGLYEMHGNVWEWTCDWFEDLSDPEREVRPGTCLVLRGGAWNSDSSFVRSACRGLEFPVQRAEDIGFRLARNHRWDRETRKLHPIYNYQSVRHEPNEELNLVAKSMD